MPDNASVAVMVTVVFLVSVSFVTETSEMTGFALSILTLRTNGLDAGDAAVESDEILPAWSFA